MDVTYFYFDRSLDLACEVRQPVADPRELDAASALSELRYDAVPDEWVIVATHRQRRTHQRAAAYRARGRSLRGGLFHLRSPRVLRGLTASQVGTVMAAWVDRSVDLAATVGVEQVFCFENRGKDVGVTVEHRAVRSMPTRS